MEILCNSSRLGVKVRVGGRMKSSLKPVSLGVFLFCCLSACINVGPNFSKPSALVQKQWMESKDPRVSDNLPRDRNWWKVFDDPVLTKLIDTAYRQNLRYRSRGAYPYSLG